MEIANDAVRIFTLPTGKIMAHFIVYAEGHGYYISEYIGFCGFARFRGLKRSFDRLSAIDPFLVAKILNAIAVFTEHFFTAKQCHRGVTGHFHFAAAVLVLPIFFFSAFAPVHHFDIWIISRLLLFCCFVAIAVRAWHTFHRRFGSVLCANLS